MIKNYIIAALLVIVAAGAAWFLLQPKESSITVDPGRANVAETMARLCTVDIYSEVPVLDTINDKVIFAVQKQTGSVSFDLEKMAVDTTGDTVRIILPPEIVELYEATEKDSWKVIDTKNIGRFGAFRSSRLSDAEENAVKARIKKNSLRMLYDKGVIRRAREEGSRSLREMLEMVYRRPVIVTDTQATTRIPAQSARRS
jgi:hypothetical protein